jgi:hypothetical protein
MSSSARQLMHVYPDASLNWHLNADALATSAHGSFCGVKDFN